MARDAEEATSRIRRAILRKLGLPILAAACLGIATAGVWFLWVRPWKPTTADWIASGLSDGEKIVPLRW